MYRDALPLLNNAMRFLKNIQKKLTKFFKEIGFRTTITFSATTLSFLDKTLNLTDNKYINHIVNKTLQTRYINNKQDQPKIDK